MALNYSLKYKKLNFYNRVILEKEGEIVVDRQSFRLKGKGAQDHGETIFFGDMKDLNIQDDQLGFSTFSKEKYILSDFSNLFDSFLKDFLRVRNEYLAESLFMKIGMLIHEYDGSVEVVNDIGTAIPKGKSRIQFYEGGIVVVPEARECFSIPFAFLKGHEFDDDEYVLRLFLENGQNIHISKLGTSFSDVQETMENILGKMYERVINFMNEFMPEFNAQTLLKLANKLKDGRFVSFQSLKKIDDAMPAKVETMMFQNNQLMEEKIRFLRRVGGDENFFFSFCFGKKVETHDVYCRSWFLMAIPDKNIVALGRTSSAEDQTVHFFRIVIEQGDVKEKQKAKILEIDQSLLLFRFDLTPLYKDRRELRKTKYRTAIKKLSYVRILRKSYLGRSMTPDLEAFKADFEKMCGKATIRPPKPAENSASVAPTPTPAV